MSEGKIVGFDPMTGQPIIEKEETVQENVVSYNPMTGQPNVENAEVAQEKTVSYDPMTGQPIVEKAAPVQEKIVGYDPMTGQPIVEKAAPVQEKIVGYDPMTGAPITEGSATSTMFNQPVMNNQKPASKAKGLGGAAKVLLAIAAVVVLVLVAVFSGVFTSSHTKVFVAVGKTFMDESKLSKACQGLGVLAEDSYTISALVEVEGQEIEGSFAKKKNEMQLTGKADIQGIPEIEGTIGIDSKKVSAKVDLFDDTLFVYEFKNEKKNDGYIMEEMPDEAVELINTALTTLTTKGKDEKIAKDLLKAILKEYKEWDIEKAKKDKFEVDGKDRNCSGYTLTIKDDNLQDMVDAVIDVMKDYDEFDVLLDELDDEYKDMFKGMPKVEVTFYIYKNMLAALVIEVEENEAEILFEGGKFRTQNIVLKADGEKVAEIKGKTKGSVESYEIESMGMPLGSLEYDSKSGDLEFEFSNGYDKISAEANIKGNKNEFEFSMDMKEFGVDGDVKVSLKKGAKIKKLSAEKKFNIGTADEDEVEELAEDFMKELY